MATRMLQRRGTAAEWAAQNPILASGEIGFETDTKILKLGDGVTAWNDIDPPYLHRSGGQMTGPLNLVEPVEASHAVRKVDLDENFQILVDQNQSLNDEIQTLTGNLQTLTNQLNTLPGVWESIEEVETGGFEDLDIPSAKQGLYDCLELKVTNISTSSFPSYVGMRMNGEGISADSFRSVVDDYRPDDADRSGTGEIHNGAAGLLTVAGSIATSYVIAYIFPTNNDPSVASAYYEARGFRNRSGSVGNLTFATGRWSPEAPGYRDITSIRVGVLGASLNSVIGGGFSGTVRMTLKGRRRSDL